MIRGSEQAGEWRLANERAARLPVPPTVRQGAWRSTGAFLATGIATFRRRLSRSGPGIA